MDGEYVTPFDRVSRQSYRPTMDIYFRLRVVTDLDNRLGQKRQLPYLGRQSLSF